ncbi:S1 family peptidase [Paenibacillus lactis]|uniref:S1 family peptidase n=1 Tax=Paenibacillus lactis TaxID=228574 RepID=UPI002041E181|nr:S1 family peptidase [Paenibacillus lactis]MCM3494361.1 S1 family peptidase [Paenibacillus lactis]
MSKTIPHFHMKKVLYAVLSVFSFAFFMFFYNQQVFAEVDLKELEKEVSQEQISSEMDDIIVMQNEVASILGSYEEIQNYGTVYIDRANGFKIVIGFKNEDLITNRIKNVLSEKLGEKVEFAVTDITYNELSKIKDDIFDNRESLESSGIHITSVGVDEENNKVNVIANKVDNLSIASQLFEEKYGGTDDIINFVFDPEAKNYMEFSRRDNHSILGGGIRLQLPDGGTCSTAFTATQGNTKFLATAGHCLNGDGSIIRQWSNNVGTDHVSYFQSRGFDIGLINVTNSGRKISNYIFANAVTYYDAKYTNSGSFLMNQYVCKAGITTNYTCGQVQETSTSYKDDVTGVTVKDVVKIYATGNTTEF